MVMRDHLLLNYRCLYLNTEPMIAGMRSYLAAADVDVAHETARGSLVFSAERPQLADGVFNMDVLLKGLESELNRALQDGYAGLFATGDVSWEMGPNPDIPKLLEYERQLEAFSALHPEMKGICQYHAGSLPRVALQRALETHRALFLTENFSVANLHYQQPTPDNC